MIKIILMYVLIIAFFLDVIYTLYLFSKKKVRKKGLNDRDNTKEDEIYTCKIYIR